MFAAPLMSVGEIARYDAHGTFVGTEGRAGAGPGEFGLILNLFIGPGDSLVAVERGRMTLLPLHGGDPRIVRLRGQITDLDVQPGGFLALVYQPEAFGSPSALARLDGRGAFVHGLVQHCRREASPPSRLTATAAPGSRPVPTTAAM